ncbi:hypothetical protein BJ912DRAFT_1023532 [Pholiota molesta]|nr:hypothetical protein BJ912DRAFT_1023532 [Pholiota molesta]
MPPKSTARPPSQPSAPPKQPIWEQYKKTPRKRYDEEEYSRRYFAKLCAQIEGGHFSQAVRSCDSMLQRGINDWDLRRTKLFLLLQIEQYNEALALIDSDEGPDQYAYERAYALYRLQRASEAREILESIKKNKGEEDRGIIHLEAQLNYREGLYKEASELYNQLLDTAEPGSEEHSDILTNLQASQQHLDFIERGFLHALDALPTSVTSTLESAPPPVQPLSGAAALASASAIASASAEQKQVPQRKKKIQPDPPPDPERWVKKSERSTFGQGRRRKGQGGGGGATQGSSSLENAPTPSAPAHTTSKSGGGKKKKK